VSSILYGTPTLYFFNSHNIRSSIITWCLIFQFIFQHHTNVPTVTLFSINVTLKHNNSPLLCWVLQWATWISLFQVEYQDESCSSDHKEGNGCVHVKRISVPLQIGGDVIYGVAHQHSGGIGSTLYGQVICNSYN